LCAGFGLIYSLSPTPPGQVEIAGFTTSLNGRTGSQRHNARRAAEALNGKVIAPKAVFSFNQIVRSWSWDQGYVKAPVSFDGDLVRAYGGGVCQTSTTLYNAALLAGLPILERHPHVFAPRYVPPGRDAAVAQSSVDLRIRNPYPWPIRIRSVVQGDRLEVRLFGAERPEAHVQISSEPISITFPARRTRVVYRPEGTAGRAYVRNPGAVGYRVRTYRTFYTQGKETRRERLSDDSYPAMDRVVNLTEESP
jgi:vancomycin resistance protein YoaR